ncbi:hypothetical protein [Pseudolysinimonas sp.]
MSLDQFTATITSLRDKASATHTAFSNRVTQIRNDPNLSPAGKQAAIRDLYDQHAPGLEQLAAEEKRTVAGKQNELRRAVFGLAPTDSNEIMKFRDAQDRADTIEDERTAQTVLERAILSSDTTLAAAVLERAQSLAWGDVVATYSAAYPDKATYLGELEEINSFADNIQQNFIGGLTYHLAMPSEIATGYART